MSRRGRTIAIEALRWVLGGVLFLQARAEVFDVGAAAAFAHTGLPDWCRLALGWGEMAAALLFLLPWTVRPGAVLLLAVLAGAAAIHLAHGRTPGSLLIDVAAVVAVLADGKDTIPCTIAN